MDHLKCANCYSDIEITSEQAAAVLDFVEAHAGWRPMCLDCAKRAKMLDDVYLDAVTQTMNPDWFLAN